MSNGPGRKTDHHRKPSSLGGKRTNGNISIVPRRMHAAWHKLFENHSALQILSELRRFAEIFSVDATDGELCSPGCISKQRLAWEILFRDMDIPEILNVINAVWIDPDYEFILRPTGTIKCVRKCDH